MTVPLPPGVFDIVPDDPDQWRSSHLWQHVESVMRDTAIEFGYREIRTPIFERKELFHRVVGETTDIVSKEMYEFQDKGERWMALRPEGTAPVIRAFIDNQLQNHSPIQKLFYIGPMFRYDRPQAGRYRQHHQFGAEAIGVNSPEQDVELIDLLLTVYKRLGLVDLKLFINCIGDTSSRDAFRNSLKEYLRPYLDKLSRDSQARFETNPLRILDSKDPEDIKIVSQAPSILNYLSPESKNHFQAVQDFLGVLGIPYEINNRLVRGLDYYNGTVFEVVAGELGAQNSIGGGGRYDGLIKQLGGPDLPSIGFGNGIERTIQTMIKQNISLPKPRGISLFIIPLGDKSKKECFLLTHILREQGIATLMDFSGKKLNKAMQYADHIHANYVIVVGDDELKTGEVLLKEMSTGDTTKIAIKSLPLILRLERDSPLFISHWEDINRPFDDKREGEFFMKKLQRVLDSTRSSTMTLQSSLESLKNFISKNIQEES